MVFESRRKSDIRNQTEEPTPAEIAMRAYEIYVRRGGEHGRDIEDWFEAERQLRVREYEPS